MPASVFTEERFAAILARLSDGEPLTQICREAGMPSRDTVRHWCRENAELDKRFQQARDDGHDAIADECLAIADNTSEEAASRKVRVWARTELLKKWSPRRYGDRMQHAGDGGGPVTIQVITGLPEPEAEGGID